MFRFPPLARVARQPSPVSADSRLSDARSFFLRGPEETIRSAKAPAVSSGGDSRLETRHIAGGNHALFRSIEKQIRDYQQMVGGFGIASMQVNFSAIPSRTPSAPCVYSPKRSFRQCSRCRPTGGPMKNASR
jgi:hypothetical protein